MIKIEPSSDPSEASVLLRELRTALSDKVYETRLGKAVECGYRVIVAKEGNRLVGALGYRFTHDLFWGSTLFVDDLIVTEARRGSGIGEQLLSEIRKIAKVNGCDHMRLCSGLSREDAHRFYERSGMKAFSLQFAEAISER